jgi:hypothetical protein
MRSGGIGVIARALLVLHLVGCSESAEDHFEELSAATEKSCGVIGFSDLSELCATSPAAFDAAITCMQEAMSSGVRARLDKRYFYVIDGIWSTDSYFTVDTGIIWFNDFKEVSEHRCARLENGGPCRIACPLN